MNYNSLDIMHYVILASILEPIPEKKGCTTRKNDWQNKSKLEYFLISGVNIGRVFHELAERIKHNNYKQPDLIYDLAYKAQKESLKNRKGGKINFGIIELMIPIVTTQLIEQKYDISILDKVEKMLQNTTKEDVKYHYQFRKIAKDVSKQFPNTTIYDTPNLYEYYKIDKSELENDVHKEYITKFERIKQAYYILETTYKDGDLLDISINAYNTILKDCNNYSGLAADYICVALYFYLINHPDVIII
ncbi:MAG: hypothetical protein HFI08_01530 [Bacilli bacterium]|jgi:hypothetical protein|nr:hypothetical protein [Bacilli bacterium]